jgi:hypothetical protein
MYCLSSSITEETPPLKVLKLGCRHAVYDSKEAECG